jgi:hypothetical protein
MPSTTVHFPPDTLKQIDAVARRRGVSRNRFVIEACDRAVAEDAGEWPRRFFEPGLTEEELRILREAGTELEQQVLSARRNRGAPLL